MPKLISVDGAVVLGRYWDVTAIAEYRAAEVVSLYSDSDVVKEYRGVLVVSEYREAEVVARKSVVIDSVYLKMN